MVRKDDERVRVYPFWQRVIYHAKRFYEVLRHAATVISIAFACFNIWQFVDDT